MSRVHRACAEYPVNRNIMAALVEGHQYGLSSLDSTSAGKSVVHVKLTDSALKAIEEFGKLAVCGMLFLS